MTVKDALFSLRIILPQVKVGTTADSSLHDGIKKAATARQWIDMATAARQTTKVPSEETSELERLELALRCRILDPQTAPDSDLKEKILALPLFPKGLPEEFKKRQLKRLCQKYPAYAERLLKAEPAWTAKFFNFCFETPSLSWHKNDETAHWIDIFIEYPDIADLLMKYGVHRKLGAYPENMMIDPQKGVILKIDLIENNWTHFPADLKHTVPLRNRTFQGSLCASTFSFETIFKQLAEDGPDIEMCNEGIIQWNSRCLGSEDPRQWTEYQPCVELKVKSPAPETWFYPQISDTNYGLVLRGGTDCSHPSFDMVIRHKDKYRIYTKASGRDEKLIFFPLSAKQGEKMVEMVAEDIAKNRSASSPQNPDIQHYIDELFGAAFYDELIQLVKKHVGPAHGVEFSQQLEHAKKSLDPAAFESLMKPLIEKWVSLRDPELLLRLITTTLETLNLLLQTKEPVAKPSLQQITAILKSQEKDLRESLMVLLKLCFDALHPYREDILDVEQNTFLVKHLRQAIEAIPWKRLQNILRNLLIFVLSRRRGYYYQEFDPSSKKTVVKTARYVNFSSQLVYTYSQPAIEKNISSLKGKMALFSPQK